MRKEKNCLNNKTNNLVYIGLITLIWLITYIICQFVFDQKLGWDEVAYMSVAKGIATDFDFSARAYTIMGILKHGYPTNLINFPIYPIYLAIFFKIFGCSLKVAYFSNWCAALGTCLLIYFVFLELSEKSHKSAFVISLSYLFFPGVLKNCDSAMMEQAGCFLVSLCVFLIVRDYVKGRFNYFTVLKFSLSFLILWLFKSLFIGFFFGSLVFIFLVYSSKITGGKINTSLPVYLFILLSYGFFVILFYLIKKYVFYPVAPMMTFSQMQEFTQVYAEPLGGYFNNFPGNFYENIKYFFTLILAPYFIYPAGFLKYTGELLNTPGHFVCLGMYVFVFLSGAILAFGLWRKLSSIQRVFVCFSFVTILSFNIVFNFFLMSFHSNIWRYNVYYLPIYLCFVGVIVKVGYESVSLFVKEHPIVSKALLFLSFFFIYLPLFLTMIVHNSYLETWYHDRAKNNAEMVKTFLQDSRPVFIYLNDGTHTTFTQYPVRQVFKDATNEQLIRVNKILPEPIEFLFLRTSDWLFKNNQQAILKGEPIINGQYKLLGYNNNAQIIVYKLAVK